MRRLFVAGVLILILIAPVAVPVVSLVRHPSGWSVWQESDRLVSLATSTLLLAVLTCLIAVPNGVLTAVVLERVRVPGRSVLRSLVVMGLFVPLPVYAVAWQIVLGSWIPPLALEPGDVAWRPWNQGLLPAAWVHGMAGLPWVIWVVSAGLRVADRGLEEDALVAGGPAAVIRRVVVPRAVLAALVAAGGLAVQTATEIPVTDAMMVRTFAEEVYTRFVSGGDGIAGAVAVTIPVWLAAGLVVGLVSRPLLKVFSNPPADVGSPLNLPLTNRWHWASTVFVWSIVLVFAGVPLSALVWKAGGGSTAAGWNPLFLFGTLKTVLAVEGSTLFGSLLAALGTGMVAVLLAWPAAVLARSSRWFARFLFGLCVILALTPGPLVGLGLKDLIGLLVDAESWLLNLFALAPAFPPLRVLLYDQPSAVPAAWAAVVRFFPVAVIVLTPAVRSVPRDLLDAAALDGKGTWRLVEIPLTAPAAVRAILAVAALALGEVSAGKIVNPPFRSVYILRVFDQMHYGGESSVAGLCLVQLLVTGLVVGGFLLIGSHRIPAQKNGPHPPGGP